MRKRLYEDNLGALIRCRFVLLQHSQFLPSAAWLVTSVSGEPLLQDVTLTGGFGLPSDAVACFGRPVPFLELLLYAEVETSKCAVSPSCPFSGDFCCIAHALARALRPMASAMVVWQLAPLQIHACTVGQVQDVHCMRGCAAVL